MCPVHTACLSSSGSVAICKHHTPDADQGKGQHDKGPQGEPQSSLCIYLWLGRPHTQECLKSLFMPKSTDRIWASSQQNWTNSCLLEFLIQPTVSVKRASLSCLKTLLPHEYTMYLRPQYKGRHSCFPSPLSGLKPVQSTGPGQVTFVANNGSNNPAGKVTVNLNLRIKGLGSFVLKPTCLFFFPLTKLESWATCPWPLLLVVLLSSLLIGCGGDNGLLQSRASHWRVSPL